MNIVGHPNGMPAATGLSCEGRKTGYGK